MEFKLPICDSTLKVSWKFEMRIIEMALIINHYVQYATLFVHIVNWINYQQNSIPKSKKDMIPEYLTINYYHSLYYLI